MKILLVIAIFSVIVFLIRTNRVKIRRWLLGLKARLQLSTLREAIHEADKDKEETGRKNIVIFNSTEQRFEPIQKRTLKRLSQAGKNKSNKAMTAGRKRVLTVRKRPMTSSRVKQIEKKSLYVTQ